MVKYTYLPTYLGTFLVLDNGTKTREIENLYSSKS